MSNTHGTPDTLKEWQAIGGDLLPACLLTSSGMTPPGSGLTLAAASCTAYARSATDLVYIEQPAVSVTVPNVAGSHWLIAHRDTHSAVASWSRRAGSHFLTLQSATPPTIPDGAVLVAQLTVAGGNLTAVDTTPALSPPLSRQTADAVAITDGRISLGGHASTGVLDVQGSVVASDEANIYNSVRVWPVAPSGATQTHGVRIEPATGAAAGSATHFGVTVTNPPATSGQVSAAQLQVSAGTGRYNVNANGTAVNYFAGAVGIKDSGPTFDLDVNGTARVRGNLVVNPTTPPFAAKIALLYARASEQGLTVQPSADSGGGNLLACLNAAGGIVGSISTTATATAFTTSSDTRLKHAVQALTGALDAIQALRPVTFKWNSTDESDIGFLAHELMTVAPQAVTGQPDELHPDGTIRPQQVDNSKLIPILTAALKELLAQVELLSARVATMEEALGM